jgi:hypothetical protein
MSSDGGTFPAVDDLTMSAWRAEARANPPRIDDWAHMIGMLRLSAELERYAADHPDEPGTAIGAAECALDAVVKFLQKQPYLDTHGEAVAPLARLRFAMRDVTEGRSPAMFKPVPSGRGNPVKGQAAVMIQALAARALSEFIEARVPKKEAAGRIAKALKRASSRGMGRINAKTVIHWRERIMQGPGPGAPDAAIAHYKESLPPGMGSTPLARAEKLLEVLRGRSASLV